MKTKHKLTINNDTTYFFQVIVDVSIFNTLNIQLSILSNTGSANVLSPLEIW